MHTVRASCGAGLAAASAVLTRVLLGPANRVTLARLVLALGVATLVAQSFGHTAHVGMLVGIASVALVLDAVDGRVARHTHTVSAFGARFDMEVDAFLILVLSCFDARLYGAWVLLIGAARYLFVAAGRVWPWLRRPTPPRYWCKVVAAIQGIVLTAMAAQLFPRSVAIGAIGIALALLTESFGRDVWWLARNRHATAPAAQPAANRVPEHV